MKKLVILLMFICSSSYAFDFTGVGVQSFTIDAQGNYTIVTFGPTTSTGYVHALSRLCFQVRPYAGYLFAGQEDYKDKIAKWVNIASTGRPILINQTSSNDVSGVRYKTYTGQIFTKDISLLFDSTHEVQARFMFVVGSSWSDVLKSSMSKWFYKEATQTVPNVGASVEYEGVVFGGGGYILIIPTEATGRGCFSKYQVKFQYYNTDISDWTTIQYQDDVTLEWYDWSGTTTAFFTEEVQGYREFVTDGATRFYCKDTEGNEAGPFSGPNIMNLDGFGTNP